jgi:hypothetical protein
MESSKIIYIWKNATVLALEQIERKEQNSSGAGK